MQLVYSVDCFSLTYMGSSAISKISNHCIIMKVLFHHKNIRETCKYFQ